MQVWHAKVPLLLRGTMHNRFADLATLGDDGDGEEWQIAVGKKRSPKVKAPALHAAGAEGISHVLLLTSPSEDSST